MTYTENTRKRYLFLFLIFILLCSFTACSFAENKNDGIQKEWGSSKEEIQERMGEPGEAFVLYGYQCLGYKNQKISKFISSLIYLFNNDQLFAKMHMFINCEYGSFDYLKEALTVKYGTPNDRLEDFLAYINIIGRKLTKTEIIEALNLREIEYSSWNQGDTVIVLHYNPQANNLLLYYGQQNDFHSNDELDLEGI